MSFARARRCSNSSARTGVCIFLHGDQHCVMTRSGGAGEVSAEHARPLRLASSSDDLTPPSAWCRPARGGGCRQEGGGGGGGGAGSIAYSAKFTCAVLVAQRWWLLRQLGIGYGGGGLSTVPISAGKPASRSCCAPTLVCRMRVESLSCGHGVS